MTTWRWATCALTAAVLSAGNLSAATNLVTGVFNQDTTLSGTNLLRGTVVVTNDVVLTIEPGTTLLMNTGATLVVYGQLLANGTAAQPVAFTRATTAARWKQLMFIRAQPSRFSHCVFEFANSVGDHQNYYPTNCSPAIYPPRAYHEAIVSLASHLDFEDCTFRNLPDTSTSASGDAIAIIADDANFPGEASAHVRRCQFRSIGQGIHSRFSYVLVEECVFSDKRGDNDDIDMYGESSPVPLIRNNVFLAGHEDKINPTRCSAIIVGNIVSGSDDHGIVLRDKCSPVVMNNVIYNCSQAGISVQNQCDALIANNTIVNCLRGIRLFDHFDRHGPRYCLFPGSGRATVINNTIWDCPTSLTLTDSPDGHSYVNVAYCNIEGGQASASVSANSTLVWGPGNFNLDPRFVGLATNNFTLLPNSPCIDAGTNVAALATNFTVAVTNDYAGVPRPLDGNGDGQSRFDIGAYEFLLPTADSNGDGIPDGWTWGHGLNPADPAVSAADHDQDGRSTWEEWVADTDPTDALSVFRITTLANVPPVTLLFPSSSNRVYSLFAAESATNGFTGVPGQVDIPGTGSQTSLSDTNPPAGQGYYRVRVRVP